MSIAAERTAKRVSVFVCARRVHFDDERSDAYTSHQDIEYVTTLVLVTVLKVTHVQRDVDWSHRGSHIRQTIRQALCVINRKKAKEDPREDLLNGGIVTVVETDEATTRLAESVVSSARVMVPRGESSAAMSTVAGWLSMLALSSDPNRC